MMRIFRIAIAVMVAIASQIVAIQPAKAAEISAIGGVVSWDASTFYQPTGCSNFSFNYVNGTGIRLLEFGMTITSKFGDKLVDKSVIGMPAGITGSWSVQICASDLADGLGPYNVVLSVEDYQGSVRTGQGSLTFLSRSGTPSTPVQQVPITPISAGQSSSLSAIGGVVSWDASTFYQPTGCSNFSFNYVNGTGIRLLEFGMTITSKFGDKLVDKSVIGMPAGITGSWSVQICASDLADGLGPYNVVLSVEDYQGSVRTAQGQLTFISRSGVKTPMVTTPVVTPKPSVGNSGTITSILQLASVKIGLASKKATISWPSVFDASGIETNYQVRITGKNKATFGAWRNTNFNTTYTFTGLSKGGRYQVEVRPLSNLGPGALKRVTIKAK